MNTFADWPVRCARVMRWPAPAGAFPIIALLLYSACSSAGCTKPELPDPTSLRDSADPNEMRTRHTFPFQSAVYQFIDCQRSSLEKRAVGLAPAQVQQLILRDRAAEDRALAELESVDQCYRISKRESDPAAVRTECENAIEVSLRLRLQEGRLRQYPQMANEQRSAYGGVWTYRALDLGPRQGCMDGPCIDRLLGVEVSNMTPVVLTCNVTLTVSSPQGDADRSEQVITLNPGDAVPAAPLTTRSSAQNIEPAVECTPAPPLAPAPRVPAGCVVNWLPRALFYPKELSRSAWQGGAALVEFTGPAAFKPTEAISVVQADSPFIGESAQKLFEAQFVTTNCPGRRFRVRVEFRPFACDSCWNAGVVTMYQTH